MYDWQGRTYVLALVGIIVCHSLAEQLHKKHSGMTEAKAQVALTGMLYKKVTGTSCPAHVKSQVQKV